MKNIIIVIIILVLVNTLWGQQVQGLSRANANKPESVYDEKEIMKKQAERYSARQKYEQANTIYRELMEKYPDDWEIVEDLLTNLMRVSNFEETAEILELKKDALPQYNYLKLKIPLLIRDGETKEAFRLGDQYLKEFKNNVNAYLEMSQIYSGSRQYEKAAQVLEDARKVTKDDYLFTLELARAYQNQSQNQQAAAEYLKHLERNKNYLHYVMNNLKGILNRDSTVIKTIKQVRENTDNKEVQEAYALCLAYLKNYQEALIEYQQLDEIKLLNFAEELNKTGNYDVALQAYQQYELRVDDPDLKAEVQIAKAEIYLQQHKYDLAENELMLVYNNEKLLSGKYRYRTQAAKVSRLLLADLCIRLDRSPKMVIKYLTEAAQYALNDMQRKEIEFAVIDYRLKTGDLDTAGAQLAELLTDEEPGTDIYKQSIYYTWQIALMQQDALADSLLGELILSLPDSKLTTQALYLTQIISSLPEEYHPQLFEAWRLHGLYKNQAALAILTDIYELSGDDEIQLLAAEWQQDIDSSLSLIWWQKDFENELLKEYADLQILQQTTPDSLRQEFITDFLKENPQSIFAPRFRNELSKIIKGR
ncbi:MAG: tetratricopeptide repeat protein [Candidatus Cloacimonetes bacterium]|nr:tetratricopeptide repeat protein [Candidatus Cloacimonadota bacterium]